MGQNPCMDEVVPSPGALAAGNRLVIDRVTVEITSKLRDSGVRSVLLKGPTVARWLYENPGDRPYVDTDLLVRPDDVAIVRETLTNLGYSAPPEQIGSARPLHAEQWTRPGDGSSVDVHSTLEGVGVPPEDAWTLLTAETASLAVLDRQVEMLEQGARLLHVVLHAAQHGRAGAQSLEDLRRACERLDRALWSDAHRLAERLNALAAFSVGLRLLSEGQELAVELGVPTASSTETELLARSLPPATLAAALGFEWALTRPRLFDKFRAVFDKFLVPPRLVRERYGGEGRLALARGYLRRWAFVLRTGWDGFREWRRARRSIRT